MFLTDADRNEACAWLSDPRNSEALKIDMIVDYGWTKRDKLGRRAWGRSWRCDHGKWVNLKRGDVDGAGQPWAKWIHVELGFPYTTTDNGILFEQVWRGLPKP